MMFIEVSSYHPTYASDGGKKWALDHNLLIAIDWIATVRVSGMGEFATIRTKDGNIYTVEKRQIAPLLDRVPAKDDHE